MLSPSFELEINSALMLGKFMYLGTKQGNVAKLMYLCSDCRNSVRLAIRKLTYAPEEQAPQPSAEATKEFMMSPGNLRLEASLDKEVWSCYLVKNTWA